MKLKNKKFLIALLCLAILSFAVLVAGGEYLHVHAHDHEQPFDQTCKLYHFLIQSFIAFIIFLVSALLKQRYSIVTNQRIFYVPFLRNFHYLRAPPVPVH